MVMCFVPDCKHYSEQKTCKFFVFPADPTERKIWMNLIRRQDREPSKHSLVCSCHFLNMERKNRPTIFEFNVKRKFTFESPERRKRIVKPACVDSALVSALSATNINSDITGPSIIAETPGISRCESIVDVQIAGPSGMSETPSTSRSESVTDIFSTFRSASASSASLEAENYFLKQELKELSKKLEDSTKRFSYEQIKNNDSHVLMYTGIPTHLLFMTVHETMSNFTLNYYAKWQVKLLPKIDQLLMTLMKLRMNLPHEDLAIRFNCSSATVTNIVMTWIYALHEVFFKQLMKTIPSRKKNQACLPAAFFNFKNCRIILDCTEIYSAIPSSLESQRLTYSSYKHRNTWKLLVGVAPNGVITYVSRAYPGSTSDKKIVEHCEILKQMHYGDLVLADKGFLIQDLLPDGVSLNIPPFLTTPQFTESQVYETQRIARARIHVERAIRRIKCFNILQKVPQYYLSQISIIFQLCAALTNFQYPLIKEVEEYYS